MHKHLQLLLQSYHLLSQGKKTPELAECRAMIEELQQRGEKALKYKNALLSKLNPATTGGVAGAAVAGPSEVEDVDASEDKPLRRMNRQARRVTVTPPKTSWR